MVYNQVEIFLNIFQEEIYCFLSIFQTIQLLSGTRVWFEIMKMLQLQKAQDIKVEISRATMINATPYDSIIANQPPPRVLTTHLPPHWLSPKFRYLLYMYALPN